MTKKRVYALWTPELKRPRATNMQAWMPIMLITKM